MVHGLPFILVDLLDSLYIGLIVCSMIIHGIMYLCAEIYMLYYSGNHVILVDLYSLFKLHKTYRVYVRYSPHVYVSRLPLRVISMYMGSGAWHQCYY